MLVASVNLPLKVRLVLSTHAQVEGRYIACLPSISALLLILYLPTPPSQFNSARILRELSTCKHQIASYLYFMRPRFYHYIKKHFLNPFISTTTKWMSPFTLQYEALRFKRIYRRFAL